MAEITEAIPAKVQLKKEKTSLTPLKSSTEILSELFGQFNAKPPEISESLRSDSDKYQKKLKKKKKHKEKKKKKSDKRKRSSSVDSFSSGVESPRKKSKKSKHKKHKKRSKSSDSENGYVKKKEKRSYSPDSPLPTKSLHESSSKNDAKDRKVILDMGTFSIRVNNDINTKERKKSLEEPPDIKPYIACLDKMDSIPRPKTPDISQIKLPDELSSKTVGKMTSDSVDKCKAGNNKIQIKNLKFSSVFEANVKMAEEEARKKAEKYEDGELSDSSSYGSMKIPTDNDSEIEINKSSDLREKLNHLTRHNSESDKNSIKVSKSGKKYSDKDKTKSTEDKLKECRSRSKRRSKSKSPKRSRSKSGSVSRSRRRSRSRSRHRHRSSRHHHSDDKRTSRTERRRSKDRDSRFEIDKKRLLEIARKNAISMLQNGALPAAVVLGPLAQQKVISAIKSGGKSVDELTDFCKNLSRQEALGELSSVSEDSDNSEINESEARPFHHPFLVKDKAPIVLNIKGGTALPTHTFQEKTMEQSKVLRLQFPVSSGSQHRGAEGEWRPVSPSALPALPKHVPNPPLIKSNKPSPASVSSVPLAICAPPEHPVAAPSPAPPANQYGTPNIPIPIVPGMAQPVIVPAVPPGPQVFPSEANAATIDIGSIVSQRLTAIRKLQQNPNDVSAISQMYQVNKEMSKWAQSKQEPGQFTGSTGAQILTPRELASGYQAWVKRDQLQTAAPVSGGMGMHLLQKMGWKPGEGLGKEKNGSLTPLLLEIKLDTKGLVAKEETKQRNNPRRGGTATVKTLAGKHPVSLLGEFCSKRKLGVPSYSLCFECGPDHKKNFLFKVTVNGVEYQPNVASANKKQAKADAAQLCLQKLGLLPN